MSERSPRTDLGILRELLVDALNGRVTPRPEEAWRILNRWDDAHTYQSRWHEAEKAYGEYGEILEELTQRAETAEADRDRAVAALEQIQDIVAHARPGGIPA